MAWRAVSPFLLSLFAVSQLRAEPLQQTSFFDDHAPKDPCASSEGDSGAEQCPFDPNHSIHGWRPKRRVIRRAEGPNTKDLKGAKSVSESGARVGAAGLDAHVKGPSNAFRALGSSGRGLLFQNERSATSLAGSLLSSVGASPWVTFPDHSGGVAAASGSFGNLGLTHAPVGTPVESE